MPAPNPLAGDILTATLLRQYGSPINTTPAATLTASTTSPTLGAGSSILTEWFESGSMIDYWARINFGSSGVAAGTGTYRIALPVDAHANWVAGYVGGVVLAQAGGARRNWKVRLDTQTRVVMQDDTGNAVSAVNPWAWAANDWIQISIRYRRADS